MKLHQRDYTGAIKDAEKAIALNSSYADGYALLAWILHFAGRPEEGLDAMRRAIRLNPRVPAVYQLVLAANHYALGSLDRAVELLESGVEISPNYQQLRVWLAAAYAASQRRELAEGEAAEILTLNPEFTVDSVETAGEVGRETAGEFLVDDFIIPNVHSSIFAAITATTRIERV